MDTNLILIKVKLMLSLVINLSVLGLVGMILGLGGIGNVLNLLVMMDIL